MTNTLDRLRRLVTGYPWITILVLLIVTVALGAGSTHRAEPPETSETLPQGSEVAKALAEIEELFGDAEAHVATLVFRGEALTPQGLAQMDSLVGEIVADPSVGDILAPPDPVFAPSLLVRAVLGVDGFDSVTQTDIDSVRNVPGIGRHSTPQPESTRMGRPSPSPTSVCRTPTTSGSMPLRGRYTSWRWQMKARCKSAASPPW